jgi:hypothetical protein
VCKDLEGNILTDETQIFKNGLSTLMNSNKNKNVNCQQPPEDYTEENGDVLKPTKEEIAEANWKIKE